MRIEVWSPWSVRRRGCREGQGHDGPGTEARDVADAEMLRKVAAAVGLDQGRVDDVLASDEHHDAVRADVVQARSFGATGVPFSVVDRRFGAVGAQPVEVLREVLDRARAEANPVPTKVADDRCGPEGCDD